MRFRNQQDVKRGLEQIETKIVLTEVEAGQLIAALRVAQEYGPPLEIRQAVMDSLRSRLLQSFVAHGGVSLAASRKA